jgi:hypothetical protein
MRDNGECAETEFPIDDLIEAGAFKGKNNSEEPLETGEGVDHRAADDLRVNCG